MKLGELNQSEAKKRISKNPIALLPIGATEVHGDHLPLSTDTILAERIAEKLADKLDNAVILPSINYGQIWSLRDFPGSITLSTDTLVRLIVDIGQAVWKDGIKRLAIINGHVGNNVAIKLAARQLYEECELKVYFFTYPGANKEIEKVCTSKRPHGSYFHACEIETSYMLYLAEEYVDMSKAVTNYPDFPEDFDTSNVPWSEIMSTAVMGDAKAATVEKGRKIIDQVVDNMARILNAYEEK